MKAHRCEANWCVWQQGEQVTVASSDNVGSLEELVSVVFLGNPCKTMK